MIQKKRALILNLLLNIHNTVSDSSLKRTISNLRDTVVHTAPEIMDSRWVRIYQICSQYLNDQNNPEHEKCFNMYQNALKEYKTLL